MAGVPVLVPALFAANGTSPASGAKLYAYIKGTSTPQTFYTDEALTTPAANPTIASSLGATVRYLDPSLSYDLVAKTSDEATTLFSVTFNALVQNVVLGAGWDTVLGLPAAGILDNLNGVRSVATYAALTALTTATGLADNAVYYTYARTTEEDGGAGHWRYDSASTATANGGTILAIDGGGAGRFFRIDTDIINVRSFAGAIGSQAEEAFEAAAARVIADDAGTGVVFVPRGTVYALDSLATPVVNVGFLQVSPRYQGDTEPPWSAAVDFYGTASAPSNVWLSLEGRVDRGSGSEFPTQIGLYTGMIVDPTSSVDSYLKATLFSRARQLDPSTYGGSNIFRDLAASVGQGYIAAANATGRVWGGYFEFKVESTGDGLANGIEIDCFNSGTTQTALNTTTSKYGLRVFASTGHTTSAVHIDFDSASGSNEFEHGVSINPDALASTGYAFLLDGRAAIMPTGVAAFGTETPRASYALTLDSAGSTKQVIISDGANESVLVFLDTGTLAASIGFNNTAGRLRIAYAENVNTPLFEFSAAGVLGVGGAVPSAGSLTNGLFIKNGAAPTVPPSGGVFLYCVSGILKIMNTSGVEFPLNT